MYTRNWYNILNINVDRIEKKMSDVDVTWILWYKYINSIIFTSKYYASKYICLHSTGHRESDVKYLCWKKKEIKIFYRKQIKLSSRLTFIEA